MVIRENVTEKTPLEKILWKHLAFLYWTEVTSVTIATRRINIPRSLTAQCRMLIGDVAAIILLVRRWHEVRSHPATCRQMGYHARDSLELMPDKRHSHRPERCCQEAEGGSPCPELSNTSACPSGCLAVFRSQRTDH